MKMLTLKSFSQEVEIADHEKVKYFLVFEDEEGDTVRLPTLEETTRELAKYLYASGGQKTASAPSVEDAVRGMAEQEMAEEEDRQFSAATVFGDEGVESGDEEGDSASFEEEGRYYGEDEVPSL